MTWQSWLNKKEKPAMVNSCFWEPHKKVVSGRWYIIPPIMAIYTAYILPSGGLYATYHLLWGSQKQPLNGDC